MQFEELDTTSKQYLMEKAKHMIESGQVDPSTDMQKLLEELAANVQLLEE